MDQGERNQEMRDELHEAVYAGDIVRAQVALEAIYAVSTGWQASRLDAVKRRALGSAWTAPNVAQTDPVMMADLFKGNENG